MTLSFLLALLLAWPTFGLSLLAWFGWRMWIGYSRAKASQKSEVMTALLEPVFRGEYAMFAMGLQLPYPDHLLDEDFNDGGVRTQKDMHQCGRLIMKYLAHNPKEAEAFIDALKYYGTTKQGEFEEPHEVLDWEFYRYRCDGPLKVVSYRAVAALMSNNTLTCFRSVDLGTVKERLQEMDATLRDRMKASA